VFGVWYCGGWSWFVSVSVMFVADIVVEDWRLVGSVLDGRELEELGFSCE